MHRRWLTGLRFAEEAHHIVLKDCIATVDAAKERRDRLTVHIEKRLADWTLAPVVEALQALRGMALVAAATIVAELGDISRFSKAEQLMSYLGLVPSEDSSGKRRRQGGITKAGNGAARRMLIGGLELPLPGTDQQGPALTAGATRSAGPADRLEGARADPSVV